MSKREGKGGEWGEPKQVVIKEKCRGSLNLWVEIWVDYLKNSNILQSICVKFCGQLETHLGSSQGRGFGNVEFILGMHT